MIIYSTDWFDIYEMVYFSLSSSDPSSPGGGVYAYVYGWDGSNKQDTVRDMLIPMFYRLT